MKLLRNGLIGLVAFSVLFTLCFAMYNNMQLEYDFSPQEDINGSLNETLSTLDLQGVLIISGVDDITQSIGNLTNPTGTEFDILGSLASAGIGIVKTTTGILTAPFEIISAIFSFYGLPGIMQIGFWAIITIIVFFIILSIYLKQEV